MNKKQTISQAAWERANVKVEALTKKLQELGVDHSLYGQVEGQLMNAMAGRTLWAERVLQKQEAAKKARATRLGSLCVFCGKVHPTGISKKGEA